jgi:hypothetical protein
MNKEPQRCEIGEGFAFEDAAQVRLDVGGAGEARVASHEPDEATVSRTVPRARLAQR